MRLTKTIIAIILIWSSSLVGLNMERFASHAPEFFVHSLDVELHDDLALVTGNGGFMIYDISDGIRYINRYIPEGGRTAAIYNCCAGEGVAFAAARGAGMYIIDISNPQSPALLTRWQVQNQSLEDAALYNDLVVVSAHQDGLYILNVSDPAHPEVTGTFEEMENCWELAFDEEGRLFVADGVGGLVILSIDDEPDILSRMETSGNAIDIKVSGDLCAIAVGADGVDIFDVSDPADPIFLLNFNTPTYAGHIGFDGDLVAVADWDAVLVYDISDRENPELTGYYPTGYRAMGVDMRGENVYLADWSKFIGFAYGPIDGADIAFSTRRIIPVGEGVMDTSLYVFNHGQQELEVERISCNAQEFNVDPGNFNLDSGDSLELSITYLPPDSRSTSLRFQSNDTDDPTSTITLEPSGGLGVGDRAPDFSSRILGGGNYRLSDMQDRVQLIIFWASW
ncbi:MAG: hypothetical protein P9X24_08900 [Candidatus Hatepunaea meridiana]|nr:hypothetical protein [Candidatus Hatepunaea meridiana]